MTPLTGMTASQAAEELRSRVQVRTSIVAFDRNEAEAVASLLEQGARDADFKRAVFAGADPTSRIAAALGLPATATIPQIMQRAEQGAWLERAAKHVIEYSVLLADGKQYWPHEHEEFHQALDSLHQAYFQAIDAARTVEKQNG